MFTQVCSRPLGCNRAFAATTAMLPTVASAGFAAGNYPQPGTWNWPPYAEGGNMPRTTCGYVWVNP